MINIDDKAILSYGGFIVLMPAKPMIALAAIGVAAVCVAGYYLLCDENSSDKLE